MVSVLLLLALGNGLLHRTEARSNLDCQPECLQKIILQKPNGQFVIVEGLSTVPLAKIIDIIVANRSSRFITFQLGRKGYFIPEDAKPIAEDLLRGHPLIEETLEAIFVRHLRIPGRGPTRRPSPLPVPTFRTPQSVTGEYQETGTKPNTGETTEGIIVTLGPDISDVPETDQEIPDDVIDILELVERNPSSFVEIVRILEEKGVRLPNDLTIPIHYVVINDKRYRLKQPIAPKVPLNVNGIVFILPEDAERFVHFVPENPGKIPDVLTMIKQINGRPVTKNGEIVGFVLLKKFYRLPKAFKVEVPVHGGTYQVPKDLERLAKVVGDNPETLYKLLALLEFYGVEVVKAPDGRITHLVFRGQKYPVKTATPIPITIDDVVYFIPNDLEKILFHPDRRRTGKLLAELQKMEIPLDIDPVTGTIRGIVLQNILVPFPAFVNLRFRHSGRDYVIPKDIPQLIEVIEKEPLSATDMAYIYEVTGITPVRSGDNDVIGLKFNGKTYPMQPKKRTTLIINGHEYVLPRDNDRLAGDLAKKTVTVEDFLDKVQEAGYTILFNNDGTVGSIVKGADVLYLPVKITLKFNLNGDHFSIPRDLRRLATVLSSLQDKANIDPVLEQLRKVGVRVERDRDTGRIILVFNQQRVPLQPAQTAVTGNAPYRKTTRPEDGWGHGETTEEVETPGPGYDIFDVPITDEEIPDDVEYILDIVDKNPSSFVTVTKLLEKRGVRLPSDLTRPISFIVVNGKRYPLKRPITPNVPIVVDGKLFNLPKDVEDLLKYVVENPEKLPSVMTALRQIYGRVVTRNDKIVGFVILGKKYKLPSPQRVVVIVKGVRYELPSDAKRLMDVVRTNPEELYRLLALLEFYGFKINRSPEKEITSVEHGGHTYRVKTVRPIRVVIDGVPYSIPEDLRKILFHPDRRLTGKLLQKLQEKEIPLDVDPTTSTIRGIIVDGVFVPFPAFVNLRFRYKGRDYSIPKDIPQLIEVIEKEPLSAKDMAYIYEVTGITPVRSSDNDVIGLSFNRKTYPMKPKKKTTLVINGSEYVLPRDNDRLAGDLAKKTVTVEDFLDKVQEAGYTILFNNDGTVGSIVKGADVLYLPVKITLKFNLNGDHFSIPRDLRKLATVLSSLQDKANIDPVLEQLRKVGVRVERDPDTGRIILVFNQQRVPLQPAQTAVTGNAPYRKTTRPEDGWGHEVSSEEEPTSGPDISDVPITDEDIPYDIETVLENLKMNPSSFATVVKVLDEIGVSFPSDLTKPITFIVVNGKRYPLKNPIIPKVPIDVDGKVFNLPGDMPELLHYIGRNSEKVADVLTVIRQVNGRPIIKDGRIVGFIILGRKHKLPEPVEIVVTVNGVKYSLPGDADALLRAVGSDPKQLYRVLYLLELYGFRIRKGSDGRIVSVTFQDHTYPVKSVSPIRITIDDTVYSIPNDLKKILFHRDRRLTGKLLLELQNRGILLDIDPYTATIRGIMMEGVLVPFPAFINLRISYNGREYSIPKDIPGLISVLESQPLSPKDVAYIYETTGISPVRSNNNDVVGLRFNGKTYPMKPQKKTVLVINGDEYVLPRDNDKLAQDLVSKRVTVDEFLEKIQEAGYSILFNSDGSVNSVLKGVDILYLPVRILLRLNIDGNQYEIPKDLARIAAYMSTLGDSQSVDYLLARLRKLGVGVQRDHRGITLVFNEKKIPVNVISVVVQLEGKTFKLPREIGALVNFAKANKVPTRTLATALQHKGIKVTWAPDGEISSITVGGFVYPVYGPVSRPSSGGGPVVVHLNEASFELPKDIGKFAEFIEDSDIDLESLRPSLEDEGILLQVGPQNELVSLTIGGEVYSRERPAGAVDTSTVEDLIGQLEERPWMIVDVLAEVKELLRKNPDIKLNIKKGRDGSVTSVSIDGRVFKIPETENAEEIVDRHKYTFPRDFGIFFSKVTRNPKLAAELVLQLQGSHHRLITSGDTITGVVIAGKRYVFPRPILLAIETGDQRRYPVPSGIEAFIREALAKSGRQGAVRNLVAAVRAAGVVPYVRNHQVQSLYFNGKTYYVVRPQRTSVTVDVKGRVITIPDDIKVFLEMRNKKQATFGDLIIALHSVGAKIVTRNDGTVVGFDLDGNKGDLGIHFKNFINIGGRQYTIPTQIREIASALSGGNYDWSVIKKTLRKQGLTVEERGATIRIGFEGRTYDVKKRMPNVGVNLFGKKYMLPKDLGSILRRRRGQWAKFEKHLRSGGIRVVMDPGTNDPKKFIYRGVEYEIPPELHDRTARQTG